MITMLANSEDVDGEMEIFEGITIRNPSDANATTGNPMASSAARGHKHCMAR